MEFLELFELTALLTILGENPNHFPMGSSQSNTHTVTIDNDDLSTIQVSKAVADRLTKGLQTSDSSSNTKPEKKTEQSKPVNYNIPSSALAGNTQYISSLDIQKHLHSAIDENNKYWENKVKSINAANDKVTDLMNKEYERTLREVEVILPHVSKEKRANPCVDMKEKVLKCYKSNPKQSLKCLEEVNQFTSCILDTKA
ncbi:hypothetical protein M8J76_001364 [Diaphorina citri]|nr:hypothetical protein M8J75_014658 [Diaphorina citri]KAI5732532.1 hypothetical protein M8J76_001364 [Diaphorina citri]